MTHTNADIEAAKHGLSIIGGDTGISLLAMKGYDWIGEPYDSCRSIIHDMAYTTAKRCRESRGPGFYMVSGSYENPYFSWPIWAVVS